jgi:hypothetical protein
LAFQNKSELLVDLVRRFVACVSEDRAVWLFVDGGYSNQTVVRALPERVEVFGRARADAAKKGHTNGRKSSGGAATSKRSTKTLGTTRQTNAGRKTRSSRCKRRLSQMRAQLTQFKDLAYLPEANGKQAGKQV